MITHFENIPDMLASHQGLVMKIVTYNMQHDKKSKDNWSVLFDEGQPDIVLAQESLPPDRCQRPLFEDSWSQNVAWAAGSLR